MKEVLLVYNVTRVILIASIFLPERADYFSDQSAKETLCQQVRTRHLCQPLMIPHLSLHYPKNSNIPVLQNPLLILVSKIDVAIDFIKQDCASNAS